MSQFPSFLAKRKFVWMTCNSLCLWMRAFELNVSLLIRKRRLGDNDICWLWKEKTSNQHTLTRQGLCFLAVLHFVVSMKLWTYKTMWKRVGGQSPASRSTRYLGKEGERLPASAGLRTQPMPEGVSERRNVLTSSSTAGAASLRAPSENVPRDASGALTSWLG